MNISTITLAAALEAVTASGSPKAIDLQIARDAVNSQPIHERAAHDFTVWLEHHPLAHVVHRDLAYYNGTSSQGDSLDAFFEWCASFRNPASVKLWREAGDRRRAGWYADRTADYAVLLGRLSDEHGREAIDDAVDEYATRRILSVANGPSVLFDREIESYIANQKTTCGLISIGHALYSLILDYKLEHNDARDLPENTPVTSLPKATTERLQVVMSELIRNPAINENHVAMMLRNELCLPFQDLETIPSDVSELCRKLFDAAYEDSGEPWFVDGFRSAISVFGPNTTLASIAGLNGTR
jgi:hypothetical protein